MRTATAVLLLGALLMTPAASAAWTQHRGGPGSPGVVALDDAPLDVLGVHELPDPDAQLDERGPGIVATPDGLVGLFAVRGGNGGYLLMRLGGLPGLSYEPVFDVDHSDDGSTLIGYVPALDALLLCLNGSVDDDVLVALDASTGRTVWGISPTPPVGSTPGATAGVVDDVAAWRCDHAGIDEATDEIFILFGDDTQQHIEAHDLTTGELLWSAAVPATTYDASEVLELDLAPSRTGGTAYLYGSLTLSTTGLALHGFRQGALGEGEAVIAWLDRDGGIAGGTTAKSVCSPGAVPISRPGGGPRMVDASVSPAASGVRIAHVMCDGLVIIDPEQREPTVVRLESATTESEMAPVAWSREWLVAPTDRAVHVLRASQPTGGQRVWSPGGSSQIDDVVIADEDAYLTVSAQGSNPLITEGISVSFQSSLVRLDLEAGQMTQRLDLPVEENGFSLTPWEGGLLAWHPEGPIIVLGEAPAGTVPGLAVSSSYPAVRETVTLTPSAPDPVSPVAWTVAWGDGLVETFQPGETIERSFDQERDLTVRLTAVHEDGTTATAETVLHVGGTPPQDLNALQTAFAPENQDMTFGVLGILVAVIGGLIALGRRRRSRGILQRELEAIDRAVELAGQDPSQQEAVLQERRAHVKGLLVDGALDEAQFVVLERHIDELAQGLRVGLLEEELPFLPIGMARALQSMLSDGRISAWERDRFLDGLEAETRLSGEEKDAVRGLIEAWFSRDAGVEA